MASDRARHTYDETKQYRRVVPQQGRVILEADLNEASAIASEDVRHEVLDIVGPAGVPSDPQTDADGTGYAITAPVAATHELSIGPGVIYVGGWRVVQPDPELRYSNQPDWLDGPIPMPDKPVFELIALRLHEQEVSAVEDPALREVALGGPDTAQRVRLIRRVERFAVAKAACSAWADVVAAWTKLGLVFNPDDMSLAPTARLAVGFEKLGPDPKPCDPAANNGFLGAENQMIRVQIASATELLWAYDDGSALYRVDLDPDDSTNHTLKFRQAPVDAFHQPRKDQYVEVLRAAANLNDDAPSPSDDAYAAAATGVVTTLASAYQPDGAKLVLSAPLTGAYTDPKQTPALFLRVWDNRAAFTAGTPQPLVDQAGNHTGLQVTLTGGPFVAGNYWFFAVRPTTPQALYPTRYATPQPPEGPREWVCPLAVIDWTAKPIVPADCRPTFDNLVTLTAEVDKLAELERNTGCCTVTVGPEDLTENQTLQTIVDRYKGALRIGSRVTICLRPGVYTLHQPLRLGEDHSGIAIEGCHGGAVIEAAQGFEQAFLDGLFVLVHANEVTLRGLRFHLPQVPFARSGGRIADLPFGRIGSVAVELEQLSASIAIRPVHAAELTVEGCLFRYSLTADHHVFGVGIFAGSECWGLRIVDNKFVMEEDYLRHEADLTRLLFGYIVAPTITVTLSPPPPPGVPVPKLSDAVTGGTVVWALLTDAEIHGNLFSGLIASTLIFTDCGAVRIEDNRVRESYGGFWVLSISSMAPHHTNSVITHAASASDGAPGQDAFGSDPLAFTSLILAAGYPAPPGLLPGDIQQVKIERKPAIVTTPGKEKPPVLEPVDKPPVVAKRAPAAKKPRDAAKKPPDAAKPDVAKPDPARQPDGSGEPDAAQAPDAAGKLLSLEDDELALAMRFAADTGGRVLNLRGDVADALGVVFATAFGDHTRQPQTMAVRVVDNDIEARIEEFASGCALVVTDAGTDPRASVVVSANRIASSSIALPTALLTGPRRMAITGNLMENDTLGMTADVQLRRLLAQLSAVGRKVFTDTPLNRVIEIVFERWCLVAEPSLASPNLALLVAITGNVLEGLNDLPVRLGPALPPWDALNTLSLGGP